MDESAFQRLRNRRQFIFGPRPLKIKGDWDTHQVGAWFLTIQRDLPFRRTPCGAGGELLLLGFMIDPSSPELSDEQILSRIAVAGAWESLVQSTIDLSGRWILIHACGSCVRVLNDASGLRSVCYSRDESWCFSQPGLFRFVRSIQYTREACRFIGSRECRKDFEAYFPVASSPYAEVSHLLPNHYLDLNNRKTTRFWPTAPLERLDLEAAVSTVCRILENSMRAITLRGPVGFAVTAGRDSRTIFAASKAVKNRLWPYTCLHGELTRQSPDIYIGSALCKVADVEYHNIRCPDRMSSGFRAIYMDNHDPAHPVWGRFSEGMLKAYPSEMISISGNLSETGRCYYYPNGVHPETVAHAHLARFAKQPTDDFVRQHHRDWLNDVETTAGLGVPVLDLFYWEDRMAKWLASAQNEFDIVRDSFTPFSNRRVISAMLGTCPTSRIKPDSLFYRRAIEMMWPELLALPFNPRDSWKARSLHKIRKAGRQLSAFVGCRPLSVRLDKCNAAPFSGSSQVPDTAGI
jgi:hypothetical protein